MFWGMWRLIKHLELWVKWGRTSSGKVPGGWLHGLSFTFAFRVFLSPGQRPGPSPLVWSHVWVSEWVAFLLRFSQFSLFTIQPFGSSVWEVWTGGAVRWLNARQIGDNGILKWHEWSIFIWQIIATTINSDMELYNFFCHPFPRTGSWANVKMLETASCLIKLQTSVLELADFPDCKTTVKAALTSLSDFIIYGFRIKKAKQV